MVEGLLLEAVAHEREEAHEAQGRRKRRDVQAHVLYERDGLVGARAKLQRLLLRLKSSVEGLTPVGTE